VTAMRTQTQPKELSQHRTLGSTPCAAPRCTLRARPSSRAQQAEAGIATNLHHLLLTRRRPCAAFTNVNDTFVHRRSFHLRAFHEATGEWTPIPHPGMLSLRVGRVAIQRPAAVECLALSCATHHASSSEIRCRIGCIMHTCNSGLHRHPQWQRAHVASGAASTDEILRRSEEIRGDPRRSRGDPGPADTSGGTAWVLTVPLTVTVLACGS